MHFKDRSTLCLTSLMSRDYEVDLRRRFPLQFALRTNPLTERTLDGALKFS